MASWRTGYASAVGTSHIATGVPCQDASGCVVITEPDGSGILIAAVSDGAGSAAHSEKGSRKTVDRFLADFGCLVVKDPSLATLDEPAVMSWLRDLHRDLAESAMAAGHAPSDYACTLLGAVVGPALAVFVQIGDGAIVFREAGSGNYSWVFWPQNGEFANVTNFLTQADFEDAVQIDRTDVPPVELAIFSDGIERLVLDMANRSVHAPALTPIFQWLATTGAPAISNGETPGLLAFLNSDKVNSRTDDDKSLVVATRVSAEGA